MLGNIVCGVAVFMAPQCPPLEEIELFKAVDLWATKECEKQGLATDGSAKRRILGEEVIQGIRFPTMKQEHFADVVLDSGMLRKKEIVSVIKRLNSVSRSPVGFPESKRSGSVLDIHRCYRFGSMSSSFRRYDYSIYDAIRFSVDKDIVLHGVCLFGKENNTYLVEVKVRAAWGGTVLVSKTGQFSTKLLQCEKFSYRGFEVLFDKKININKNTTYEIWAKLRRPDSLRGEKGIDFFKCREVTFTFRLPDEDNWYNGTNAQVGQFPELLFSLKDM